MKKYIKELSDSSSQGLWCCGNTFTPHLHVTSHQSKKLVPSLLRPESTGCPALSGLTQHKQMQPTSVSEWNKQNKNEGKDSPGWGSSPVALKWVRDCLPCLKSWAWCLLTAWWAVTKLHFSLSLSLSLFKKHFSPPRSFTFTEKCSRFEVKFNQLCFLLSHSDV